jgi:hypothetical protein
MSRGKVSKGGQPNYDLATKQAAVLRAEAGERIALIAADR